MSAAEAGEAGDGRREQILDAALGVVVDRGFPDVRISDVAERAGTSPALVIYYFKTRDQLLTEAIRLSEDRWYAAGRRRIADLPTAAGRLEELVAMSCLSEAEGDAATSWVVWLDLWAQSARNPEVAAVRREFDEHWRTTIAEQVLEGQRDGEFGDVDAEEFSVTLSALIDGFAVQIALGDTVVDNTRAFRACMRFTAGYLGFEWRAPRRRTARSGTRRKRTSSRRSS